MFKKPQRKLYALIFLLPTFAAFVIGFIYPFIRGIYLSFFKFQIVNKAKFVGISNYLKAFKDESFLNSFWFTLGFVIVSVILINVMAFFIPYALTLNIRGSNAFRTVSAELSSVTSGIRFLTDFSAISICLLWLQIPTSASGDL